FAADGIDQFYVDLRPVERGFVRRYFDLEIQLVRRPLEGILRKLPLIGRARVFPARSAIPGGELRLVLIEPVGVQRVDGELQAIDDLAFDLIRGTEDVRVVLRKASDAEEPIEYAGALIPVDGSELAETYGQLAVAALLVRIDQD